MKRATDEFNLKYEAFLDGLKDFAPAIRMKRQAELQELMEKNMAFKQEAARSEGAFCVCAVASCVPTVRAARSIRAAKIVFFISFGWCFRPFWSIC